jgi:hypothetical protein
VEDHSDIQAALRADVERLAAPGTRRVGSRGHRLARDYLLERLTALGLAPYRGADFALAYRGGGQVFENLIGVVPGKQPGLAPVLLGAHYDTVDTPGADDNAAAVAIALDAARRLLQDRPPRDVVIALFDAEEPPHFQSGAMGSTHFFDDQRQPAGFHAAVVMDLVGHDVPFPDPGLAPVIAPLLFITGAESHPALPEVMLRSRQSPDLPVVATLNRRVGDMSDHHAFRLGGVPYFFLSCGRWEHYHARSDTPEKLNYAKMERICGYLTSLAQNLAATALPPAALDSEGKAVDTTALEIRLLEEALGTAGARRLLSAVGLRQLRTAADLDRLAAVLQGYFQL